MKILCVASHFPPYHSGGYGAVAGAFCEGLAKRGHEVRVLTRDAEGAALGDAPTVKVDRTLADVREGMSPRTLFKNCFANAETLCTALHNHAPAVIFSCGNDGIGFTTYHEALAAKSTSRIPCLTYLGDTWLAQAWRCLPAYDPWVDVARGGRRPGINRWLKKAFGFWGSLQGLVAPAKPPLFAPVTVISQFVLDDLRSAGAPVPEHVPFTYVPLDPAFFKNGEPVGHDGSPSPKLRALFVSRVEPLKGPDVAIRAVALAAKNGVNVALTIAGLHIEKMQTQLEALAASLGANVRFAGTPSKRELIALYRSHDVFLFPSRIVEGLGLVNCEAQACGLPIIGTADSGASEVIRHGETGFRVPIGDHEAMARHLGELATDRALWERLSANAMVSAKRFHPETILNTLEAALHDVVARS